MKLENEFVVPVPREQAWDVLMDVERIAPCMPGATFDGQDGDAFKGRVKVKLGPITVTYAGVATFIERDKEAGHAVIDASGKEARGSGTAKATIDTVLVDQGDSTLVKVVTDLAITGKPAQFGRGVMVEVGTKILGQFADCLAAQLGSGTAVGHDAADAAGEADAAGAAGTEDAAAPAAAPAGNNVVDLSDAQRSRASAGAAAARPAPSPAHHSHDAIDLLDAAGVPVLKRVLPLIGGLFGLWILWRVIRRLGRD